MIRAKSSFIYPILWIFFAVLIFPAFAAGSSVFQIELFGGISYINPKDFNLLSKAEEQYNDIYFIEHVRHYGGYFVNDFPEITMPIPVGLRFRAWISEALSLSLGVEGFFQKKKYSVEGTFSWAPSWHETHTKTYDPFILGLSGYSLMGGLQYRIPVGDFTDIEIGASAGWTFAELEFSSSWSYTIDYYWDESWNFYSEDIGLLEEDGFGNGFSAQGMLRLSRNIGQRFGFMIEVDYTYCRIKNIHGKGRESRSGFPEDFSWEGDWGIKKEEIHVAWADDTVHVPTNYWDGWTADQYERDFILDLSGVRLVLGFFIKL